MTLHEYLTSLRFGAPVTLDDVVQARAEILEIEPTARFEIWHTNDTVYLRFHEGDKRREIRYSVK